MSRHRFRSQPTLQRSGGRTASTALALGLTAAVALGAGAVFSTLVREGPAEPEQFYAAGPADAPARPAVVQDAPPAEPVPVQPQFATAGSLDEPQTASEVRKARTAAKRAKPAAAPTLKVATAEEEWEQQRIDYERARDAYDANERKEGYRWAQENRIRLPRYCRTAAQRTPAFVEGCMSYVQTAKAKAPERQGGSAGLDRSLLG